MPGQVIPGVLLFGNYHSVRMDLKMPSKFQPLRLLGGELLRMCVYRVGILGLFVKARRRKKRTEKRSGPGNKNEEGNLMPLCIPGLSHALQGP